METEREERTWLFIVNLILCLQDNTGLQGDVLEWEDENVGMERDDRRWEEWEIRDTVGKDKEPL